MTTIQHDKQSLLVLIDTWWNVNEYAKEELRAEISF